MEDKMKLEEELEFLKESFEAEVISKDEYEKAKARIEDQLRRAEEKEKIGEEKPIEKESIEKEEKPSEEIKKEEVKEDTEKEEKLVEEEKPKEEPKQEVKEEIKKTGEEPEIEIKEIKEPSKFKEREEEEVKKEFGKKEEPEEIKDLDEKEEDTNDILNSKNKFESDEEEKKKKGIWVPVAAVVFLIVVGYFSFLFFTGERQIEGPIEEILPLCFSDNDCAKEGMIGFCNNPGSENAECEFKEAVQVNFIVLNDEYCFNCGTSRVEKIIKGWFPGAVKEEIEFNSEEGKLLVDELGIELLPAYIFSSSLESTFKYKELKGIFSKVDDEYILSSSASGSTFYINKEEVPNRLDVFLMKDDSSTEKAEENMEEFLDLFNGKIEYNKYLINKESSMVKSLGINTFPTFLVNNKIRFSGVQPAETIKENFCKLNKLDECSEKLTESLV